MPGRRAAFAVSDNVLAVSDHAFERSAAAQMRSGGRHGRSRMTKPPVTEAELARVDGAGADVPAAVFFRNPI